MSAESKRPLWLPSGVRLHIQQLEWQSDMLTLSGPDWSFYTMCAWRLVDRHRVLLGSSDADDDIAHIFVGDSIERIEAQSSSLVCDPVFRLSSGRSLEVFSVVRVDAWVLKIGNVVIVASPAEPDDYVMGAP